MPPVAGVADRLLQPFLGVHPDGPGEVLVNAGRIGADRRLRDRGERGDLVGVDDRQAPAAVAGDALGFLERRLRRRREVGGCDDAVEGLHGPTAIIWSARGAANDAFSSIGAAGLAGRLSP